MYPTDVIESREEEGEGYLQAHAYGDNPPRAHANLGKVHYDYNYNYN